MNAAYLYLVFSFETKITNNYRAHRIYKCVGLTLFCLINRLKRRDIDLNSRIFELYEIETVENYAIK